MLNKLFIHYVYLFWGNIICYSLGLLNVRHLNILVIYLVLTVCIYLLYV